MPFQEAFRDAIPVVRLLERLEVNYYVAGSVASSMHGAPRSTVDVDIVAEMATEHVRAFALALANDYYVSEEMIHEALRHATCFNVIHNATGNKIDLFVNQQTDYNQAAMRRRVAIDVGGGENAAHLFFASAEDTILAKLDWYKQGEFVSENQWRDVQGVLKVQRNALDFDYLHDWASQLDLDDLLGQAFVDAEIVV